MYGGRYTYRFAPFNGGVSFRRCCTIWYCRRRLPTWPWQTSRPTCANTRFSQMWPRLHSWRRFCFSQSRKARPLLFSSHWLNSLERPMPFIVRKERTTFGFRSILLVFEWLIGWLTTTHGGLPCRVIAASPHHTWSRKPMMLWMNLLACA